VTEVLSSSFTKRPSLVILAWGAPSILSAEPWFDAQRDQILSLPTTADALLEAVARAAHRRPGPLSLTEGWAISKGKQHLQDKGWAGSQSGWRPRWAALPSALRSSA